MDLEDYGIQLDGDGRLVGFQAGKAAALLDWEHRKEAAQFLKVVRALYRRNWNRAHREHYNAYQRGLRAKRARERDAAREPDHGPRESAAHKRHRYYLRNRDRFLALTKIAQERLRDAIGPGAYALHRKIIAIRSRYKAKEAGKCISCPAKSYGHSRCGDCRARGLRVEVARRQAAIHAGLCSRCKLRPASPRVLDCSRCRKRQAAASRKRAARKKRARKSK